MAEERWFCRDEEEFRALREKLKRTACPHCQVTGTLILHGSLQGYDEIDRRWKSLRARRIFCSNRKAREGCGRTVSVWLADKIRRLSLTTRSVWKFLELLAGGGKLDAFRGAESPLGDSAPYRLRKRFERAQAEIRAALCRLCRPPEVASALPAAQTLAHLEAAFPQARCPIAAFQQATRTFFL